MDKRALRKYADPGRKLNLHSGVFHAQQVKYVVCSAVHNIASRRTLVLYIYAKEDISADTLSPKWTMFQTTDEYLTLCSDEKGVRWQTSMFANLGREYGFMNECAFYSLADEQRVSRFFKEPNQKVFDCITAAQWRLFQKKREQNKRKGEQKIVDRMKVVGKLPRDIKGFMYRETLPQYIFYDYCKGKAAVNGYCTACKHAVEIAGAKHNGAGVCPRCKRTVVFKSRGKRGYIIDRTTAQVIQQIGADELVIRFVKAYCRYPKKDVPEFSVYENARLFLDWNGGNVKTEKYYYSYSSGSLTPWHKGDRPVFSRWQYNFEADGCGYLYHRNLEEVLKGTPWQYSALKEYYFADPTPLYVPAYLQEYARHPMLEYLVKLRLYRLATSVVYSENGYHPYYGNALNYSGKNIKEILGLDKRYLQFLQEVNPGAKQLSLIKALLKENIQPDMELMKWCSEYGVGNEESLTVPLRYMTPYKLMKYASKQFADHKKTSYLSPGYVSMSYLLSEYKDYLCMSHALDYDMKNSFVLFPKELKEAHDRVNDMSNVECKAAYDRKIAKDFVGLQSRYQFKGMGFIVIPPRSTQEIVREGQELRHCVGQYIKDVVQGKSVILFVRKTNKPDEPYCTVELKNGEIAQAKIYRNDDPPPRVQKFIEQWKRQVLYEPVNAAA